MALLIDFSSDALISIAVGAHMDGAAVSEYLWVPVQFRVGVPIKGPVTFQGISQDDVSDPAVQPRSCSLRHGAAVFEN